MRLKFRTVGSYFVCLLALLGPGVSARGYEMEVLEQVRQRVSHAAAAAPVVVFDLDDTLVNTQERTWRILREIAELDGLAHRFPAESARLRRVRPGQVRFDVSDTLVGIGVSNVDFEKIVRQHWSEKFFSSSYVADDRPLYGAVEYVRQLHRRGAIIVYLTGRDLPRMRKGTRVNLRALGFPIGERTELMMKPSKEMSDLDFKREAFEQIRRLGAVVACFENEPVNVNAMATSFPDATMVFLDTIHSKKPDVPNPGIATVPDYLELE